MSQENEPSQKEKVKICISYFIGLIVTWPVFSCLLAVANEAETTSDYIAYSFWGFVLACGWIFTLPLLLIAKLTQFLT